MKHGIWLVALLVIILAGCQSTDNGAKVITQKKAQVGKTQTPASGETETIKATMVLSDQAAFRVGSKVVTIAQFEERIKEDLGPAVERFLAQGISKEQVEQMAVDQKVQKLVFDRMIQEEILLQLARKQGVGVDALAVDKEIEQRLAFQSGQDGSQKPSEEEMAKLRSQVIRQQIILSMIASHTVSESFKSRHILVEDEVTAQKVLSELEKGKSFADAAQEYSKDPGSAQQGGELGWTGRGVFVPEFETTAMSESVKLNTPTLVKSQFGYHIIEVQDRKSEPFKNVEALRQSSNPGAYVNASFMPWYEKLREDSLKNGDLDINAAFDPMSIPLPFPANIPTPELTMPKEFTATEELTAPVKTQPTSKVEATEVATATKEIQPTVTVESTDVVTITKETQPITTVDSTKITTVTGETQPTIEVESTDVTTVTVDSTETLTPTDAE